VEYLTFAPVLEAVADLDIESISERELFGEPRQLFHSTHRSPVPRRELPSEAVNDGIDVIVVGHAADDPHSEGFIPGQPTPAEQ
jgi:hypothetical protein